jgi:hypothetical protein
VAEMSIGPDGFIVFREPSANAQSNGSPSKTQPGGDALRCGLCGVSVLGKFFDDHIAAVHPRVPRLLRDQRKVERFDRLRANVRRPNNEPASLQGRVHCRICDLTLAVNDKEQHLHRVHRVTGSQLRIGCELCGASVLEKNMARHLMGHPVVNKRVFVECTNCGVMVLQKNVDRHMGNNCRSPHIRKRASVSAINSPIEPLNES